MTIIVNDRKVTFLGMGHTFDSLYEAGTNHFVITNGVAAAS